ncbi:hypothetical protein IEU95_15835 [Hoyosella rhizosphaerae]|uniref:Uncharacterized protein n=1 Tax=Hoyosella rhizosphaerae TaxID=1755582 RepID=A0A916XHN0_9ACTN|nr:hypothetical protein [Hoyosella rhizosphaerae]MBN4928306.1 hypothetical protein [Hoyosella rhizosphaerae]GGC73950.1 hypothetical protein GCM10011410_28930 [Hoyosella rhizosphaerae]
MAAPFEVWHACTEVPDEALVEYPLELSSQSSGIGEIECMGFQICEWQGEWYSLQFMASEHTLDEFRTTTNMTNFEMVTVLGSSGLKYDRTSDARRDRRMFSCLVAFPFERQIVRIGIIANPTIAMGAADLRDTGRFYSYQYEERLGDRIDEFQAAGQWVPEEPCDILERVYANVREYMPQQ